MTKLSPLSANLARPRASLWIPVALGITAARCGGGDEPPPTPEVKVTTVLITPSDPCSADTPTPTDLFFDASGAPETLECTLPTDPVEAAVTLAQRHDGAPVTSEVRIPLTGTLNPLSLSSTAAFSLEPGGAAGDLPTAVLMQHVGTGTGGWSLVEASVTYDGTAVRMRPTRPLAYATNYVAVLTRAPKDTESPPGRLGQSKATEALVGSTAIAAGRYEGLDAEGAARLERMRAALAPALEVLAQASPPVTGADIASIHAFTTELGDQHLKGAVDTYFTAIDDGRYTYTQTNRVVPFSEVYPGLPAIVWEGLGEIRAGTLKAPKLLDEQGHLRADWGTRSETIDIPFTLTIPSRVNRYGVAVFIPGFGRGALDGRALGPVLGDSAGTAVLTIDLRCHGARSPGADGVCGEDRNAQEVAELTDDDANNGNPEINGADGIPDASGAGFFPGDPRALRDSQIAAIIEIIHVLEALRHGGLFEAPVDINLNQIHVVAQGHAAPAAVGAVDHVSFPLTTLTLQTPSGGAGYKDLILGGPEDEKAAFMASAPAGITEANLSNYLDRLQDTLLKPLDVDAWGDSLQVKLRLTGTRTRMLMNTGRVTQYVSQTARTNLKDALGLDVGHVSQHNGACDDFFIFTCTLGDNPAWLEEAKGQIASFISSGGVTFSPPAP